MTLTLIGSTAAKHWFENFREPNDTDYHSDKPIDQSKNLVKYDIFVDERLGAWDWGQIARPEELYTMKVSHSFWEIENSWNKHMYDVLFFQNEKIEFIRELYDILLPIWKDIHARKITNLKQNKENFFKDAVKRTYDHDSIHASIAYYDAPLYERILVPGEEVLTSWDAFDKMDHEDKLMLVREEIYATALERILIPNEYKGSPGAAYAWALRRTVTSLFKNEWALWLVLHYNELARPDVDYKARHLANRDRLIRLEDA